MALFDLIYQREYYIIEAFHCNTIVWRLERKEMRISFFGKIDYQYTAFNYSLSKDSVFDYGKQLAEWDKEHGIKAVVYTEIVDPVGNAGKSQQIDEPVVEEIKPRKGTPEYVYMDEIEDISGLCEDDYIVVLERRTDSFDDKIHVTKVCHLAGIWDWSKYLRREYDTHPTFLSDEEKKVLAEANPGELHMAGASTLIVDSTLDLEHAVKWCRNANNSWRRHQLPSPQLMSFEDYRRAVENRDVPLKGLTRDLEADGYSITGEMHYVR